ncbi:hypothetical protein M1247_21130 [Mycobacterium sp. 21AC1]|uniref:hypothetical protein n=1 Tax=[Mycobacterium] appelbergii TaxID=2939269 RepID=UPI00293905FB|nr:hypothetical protein [Mycobacterium sp. 21AC1]MDV3127442.1 hypothetical protein [Mycobacterium sp. 21AC1]
MIWTKYDTFKRVTVGAALGGALFFSAGVGLAGAEAQDGQVDVAVGSAGVLEDVSVASAAQLASKVCDGDVNQVTSAAQTVDANGTEQNVCSNNIGAVSFRQNDGTAAEGDENVPQGFAEGTGPGETATTTTTTPSPTEGADAPAG